MGDSMSTMLSSPQVMIVDFDVHHGNGTQDLFYDDPSVLFIDMHEQDVWPGSGQAGERGVGEGDGYTINVPLPGKKDLQRCWTLDMLASCCPHAHLFQNCMHLRHAAGV